MKQVKDAIGNVGKTAGLVKATHSQLTESEATKNYVRAQLETIGQEKRTGSEYQNLVAIHDSIEALHDKIYKRPENITDEQSAINECNAWINEQRIARANFDLAHAKFMPAADDKPSAPKPRMS